MSGDLERLLPHRPPMLLLDRVVRTDGGTCVTTWTVPAASPWVEDGRLLRAVFVELAAQTAAAHAGAGDAAAGAPARHGALGEVAGFRLHDDARPGDVLRTTAVRGPEFGDVVRYACTVERLADAAPTLLADGTITVVRAR